MIQYQQDQKGLFTFYREQAKLEQQLKRTKNNRKNGKNDSKSKSQKLSNSPNRRNQGNLQLPPEYRLRNYLENRTSFGNVEDYPTAPIKLYEFDQHRKQQSPKGHSVVVLQQRKPRQEVAYRGSIERRRSLINKSITTHKQLQSAGIFLKNKQFPFQNQEHIESYKYSSMDSKGQQIQKETMRGMFSDMSQTKFQRKKSYFKNVSKILKLQIPIPQKHEKLNQKYLKQRDQQQVSRIIKNSHSFDFLVNSNSGFKLPDIQNKKSCNYILPKKYKSKKIDMALKAGDSQIVKRIRESLKEEMKKGIDKEDISYIEIGVNNYEKTQISIDKKLIIEKNSKLLDILRKLKRGY